MALRRSILPSRLTGAPAPEDAAAPVVQAEKPAEIQVSKSVETPEPKASEQELSPAPEALGVTSTKAVAGVADSVFSAFAPAEPQAEPKLVGTPFWQEPNVPAAEKPEVAPVAEAPQMVADIAPAAGREPFTAETASQVEIVPVSVEGKEPAPQENPAPVVAEPVVQPAPVEAEAVQPAVEAAPIAEDAFAVRAVAEPVREEKPAEAEPVPAAISTGPTNFLEEKTFEASRPESESGLKRRVREKRPRDFGTATVAKPAEAPRETKPLTAFAANVPVDTRPLDRVNESLIATGIMAGPPEDSLTQAVPMGLAVEERPEEELEAPQPVGIPEPQPVAPEVKTAPEAESRPEQPRAIQSEPVVRPQAAAAASWGVPEEADALSGVKRATQPMPRPFLAKGEQVGDNAPARQDSWQTAAPAVAPVAPVQGPVAAAKPVAETSDKGLPWMESQSAAEWEIESPDNMSQASWQQEGAMTSGEGVMGASAPLPPPADLYHPREDMAAATGPRWSQETAKASSLPPPELPGGRGGKPSGKATQTFSWGIALAALGAVGVVALVYMRPSGAPTSNAGVRQLAQISQATSPTDGISSFAPLAAAPAAAQGNLLPAPQVSSSAQIAFADVPSDQANQPIVATGKEAIPADLTGKDATFVDRFKASLAKARAEKEGATSSETLNTENTAGKETPLTPEALKKELDTIRRTLADGSSTGKMNPTDALKTAKAQMDNPGGMTTETTGSKSAMAGAMPMPAGALLPPPDTSSAKTSSGNLLPAPELYAKNPKGLPIINEPVTNQPVRVRTLSDFADADPTPSGTDKVAIPANLRPRLASTEFPKLEILSFIPGQGIIAYANGREGVLKVGENLNGWELASVSNDNAEFRSGRQSRTVTAESGTEN